jgi:acetoin utilization deacetylase AcuC-like enzyme
LSLTRGLLQLSGVLDKLEGVKACPGTKQELELVHTCEHISAIREGASSDEVVCVGPEGGVRPKSWDALSAGTGDPGYELAVGVVIAAGIRAFQPDLILISAGQDAGASEPLELMSVTTEGFRAMALALKAITQDVCEGRLLAFQDGYSLSHNPLRTLAIIEALGGLVPPFRMDPIERDVPSALAAPQLAATD